MNLREAAESGDTKDTLIALRNKLADEIEQSTSGRDIAALSRQLTQVLEMLDDLPTGESTSIADEIARKRASRRAASNE